MKNNLYVVYNRLSKRYGDVICFPSDEFASSRLIKEFARTQISTNEVEVCRVGSIDVETGVVIAESPTRIDLVDFTLPISTEQNLTVERN